MKSPLTPVDPPKSVRFKACNAHDPLVSMRLRLQPLSLAAHNQVSNHVLFPHFPQSHWPQIYFHLSCAPELLRGGGWRCAMALPSYPSLLVRFSSLWFCLPLHNLNCPCGDLTYTPGANAGTMAGSTHFPWIGMLISSVWPERTTLGLPNIGEHSFLLAEPLAHQPAQNTILVLS